MEKRFEELHKNKITVVGDENCTDFLRIKKDNLKGFTEEESNSIINLFVDALTTIQKCDLMPSQLLDKLTDVTKICLEKNTQIIQLKAQRDELVKFLQKIIIDKDMFTYHINEAQELINKIK